MSTKPGEAHRLICGDSLTGPFFEHLLTFPKSGGRLDDLFAQGLTQRLQDTLAAALVHVRDLEASVGKDLADLHLKESAKTKLDAALVPLKTLAAAWSGGVMLGDDCDDAGYQILAKAVASGEELQPVIQSRQGLDLMLKLGSPAVAYPLAFPEVFYREDADSNGFDVVVGNPPWDAIQFKSKEFLAGFDLGILEAPTARERSAIERRLLADAAINNSFLSQQEGFEQIKRANDKLYKYQKVIIDGDLAGRQLDAFRVFMERNAQLLRKDGFTGVVVPSAFHANAGATGVRQLYLQKMALHSCFSFENRKRLFDIDSRYKFAAVITRNDPSGTQAFQCGFYWQELDRLFDSSASLSYTLNFVSNTGGSHLVIAELTERTTSELLLQMHSVSKPLGQLLESQGLRLQGPPAVLHMSHEAHRFENAETYQDGEDWRRSLLQSGGCTELLLLREGKSFFHFTDTWGDPVKSVVPVNRLRDKPALLERAGTYQLALRTVAASTNDRTLVPSVCAPGGVFSHSAFVDVGNAPDSVRLWLLGFFSSFAADWSIRQFVGSNVSLFYIRNIPFPSPIHKQFLAHSALRLSCNHSGYCKLWEGQLGKCWREDGLEDFFPVIPGEDDRWAVRSRIDALVASAYSFDRHQYELILSSFAHRSYSKAPYLCLEAFDELYEVGIEAFTKKYDPYWDIPLNENLPKPVLDLKIPGQTGIVQASLGPLFDSTAAAVAQAEIGVSRAPTVTAKPGPAPAPSVNPLGNAAFPTIAELLRIRGVITSSDAQLATGLDAAGVRPHLQRLVNEGLAETEGQRRGMKYRRADG